MSVFYYVKGGLNVCCVKNGCVLVCVCGMYVRMVPREGFVDVIRI